MDFFEKLIREQNRGGISDFEGYSPDQMHFLMYDPFGKDSPLSLHKLTEAECRQVPIWNMVKFLMDLLSEKGELKLTAKGFLPVKVVADLYGQGYFKDPHIESGITKLYKETDANILHLAHIMLNISGFTKKRQGKLSLTKRGEDIRNKHFELLKVIFETFTTKFNQAYFDAYQSEKVGSLGCAYSLLLLNKYGAERRPLEFYAEKYFTAFPMLLVDFESDPYSTPAKKGANCYAIRTFERFLLYFGLVELTSDNRFGFSSIENEVQKAGLFDKFIVVKARN